MIDTDRKHIMRKSLAHVNRHSRLRKENPLKPIVFWIAFLLLTPLAVIFFVRNADAVDRFFNTDMQERLMIWTLPVGFVLFLIAMAFRSLYRKYRKRFWYRYKKM